MTEYYDEGLTVEEQALAVQKRINDGTIWRMEGSAGRLAMDLLEEGLCMLPKTRYRDFYGNRVPARDDLEPGMIGTWRYVEERYGRSWANRLARAK